MKKRAPQEADQSEQVALQTGVGELRVGRQKASFTVSWNPGVWTEVNRAISSTGTVFEFPTFFW